MENNFMNSDTFTIKIIEGKLFIYMTLDQTINAVKTMFDLVVADEKIKEKPQLERAMIVSLWGSAIVHLTSLKEKESMPIVKADWYNSEQ